MIIGVSCCPSCKQTNLHNFAGLVTAQNQNFYHQVNKGFLMFFVSCFL